RHPPIGTSRNRRHENLPGMRSSTPAALRSADTFFLSPVLAQHFGEFLAFREKRRKQSLVPAK
ncbi:hypothetical protein CSUI_009531, partial [Cystoisospora suis]